MICSAGRLRVCMQAVVLGERTPLLQRSHLRLEQGWLCPRPDPRRVCSRSGRPAHFQGWSLTQFYSFDFSKSRIGVKKGVFNKRTIKVWVSCSRRCPGTFAPSAAHLTVSLYLCSSGSNTRGESRAQEGRRVSSKSPSRVRDGDEGVAGRNGRE